MKQTHFLRAGRFLNTGFPVLLLACITSPLASGITYFWDNNGSGVGFGSAAGTWTVPTVGDASQGWSTDSAGALVPAEVTTTTSDILNFGSTATGLGGGTINVSGTVNGNRLVFAGGSGPINLSGGTIALSGPAQSIAAMNDGNVIGSAVSFTGNASISFGRAVSAVSTFTLNGEISGPGNITFTTPTTNTGSGNAQVILLGAANTYTGNTTITTANINNTTIIRSTIENALPVTTILTLSGGAGNGTGRGVSFDLNGNNQTIAGLTNVAATLRTQRFANTGNQPVLLTIDSTTDQTFSGNIIGANLGLVKLGPATQTLTSANSYTGATTVSAGKLLGTVGGNNQQSSVTVNDAAGTFGVSVTNNSLSWTTKSLTYTAAGGLEFNFGGVTPSALIAPLQINTDANFTAATPVVSVNVSAGLAPGVYPLMTWATSSGQIPTTDELVISQIAAGTDAGLSVDGNTLNLVITSTAPSITKADNADNLNLPSSWVGGIAPGPDEVARWDSTVTSANSTLLGSSLSWAGISVVNPGGPVTIGADPGQTLSLGAAFLDIDLSSATTDLTLNTPLSLTSPNLWDVAPDRTLTLNGAISGAFSITKKGAGTAVLSAPSIYSGNTVISAGTLRLGASNVLPNGALIGNVSLAGTLDLNGNSEIINGLSGSGEVDNTAGGTVSTLTVGQNGQSSTFSGILQDSGELAVLDLVKTGTGVLTLGGINTLQGSVSVNMGTLAFTRINPFGSVSQINLAGGTTLRPSVINATISVPINVGSSGTDVNLAAPNVAHPSGGTNSVTVTLDSVISGAGNVTFLATDNTNAFGLILLKKKSNYLGSTTLSCTVTNSNIFVRNDTDDALPVDTILTLDGGPGAGSGRYCDYNLNGNNQTLAGITNVADLPLRTQQIGNRSATLSTLTINNTADITYSAVLGGVPIATSGLNGNNLALTKTGSGVLTLSGNNTYFGPTNINGGTLNLGKSNVLTGTSAISIGNARLSIGSGFSDVVGTLEVTGSATIGIGSGATLAFAGGSPAWSGSLTITGAFVSGSSLQFGNSAGGLTPAQLAAISGPGLSDIALDANGYLTATVSSSGYSTWAATNAGGQGPEEDFDNDGVDNGVEYFMNSSAGFTSTPTLDGSNTLTWTNGGNIPAAAYGDQFVIQTSANLSDWSDVPQANLTSNTDGPNGTLTYTLTGQAPRFARLRVTPTP